MLKQEEYQENLLGAVQILIDSSIKGLQYDKTIICSVVKNDKAKQGEYTVSDGSITFSAYSNGTEYSVGDTVRVQIPQGDMSQDKFIQGKYVADKGTSAMTYVSPMESILDISDSLVNKLSSGIIVTGYSKDAVTQQIILKELISIEFNDSNNFNYSNLKSNKIVDTFYMQASFKTLFAGYQIMSGEYGIRADFYDNNNTIRSLYLSSKDMFGDPYNFMIYSQQGQTYSLENIDNIKRIVFYLYHNDAFSYLSENGTINSIPVFGNANVLLKDFAAGFATDLSGIEDNTVKLFTPNQTYFSNDEILKDVVNDKILQLLWYNKDENHRYIGFSDGICDTNYDELEYIAERKAISRLIPHLSNWRVPHDEKGLKLTADKEEFEPLLDKLYNLLNNDFYKTLNNYRARFKETLRTLISVPKSDISKLGTVIQSIKDYYTNCLYYGCFYNPRVDIIDKETGDPIQPKIEDQPLFPTYYACWDNLKTVYDDITEDFQNDSFLKSLKDEIESNATDYMGLYNSLKAKINVIIKEANEILTSIEFLLEDESKLLLYHYNSAIGYGEYFKDTDTYKNYINPENDKDTSNRYCIYWYRYDPLEKLYNDKKYIKGDPFFGEKWIRCKEWTNRGLPYDGINGKYYELTRFAGNTQASVILESDKMQEERFRVVLFYNHVRYDSNVLIFNNLTDLVSSTTEALTNYIKISHSNNSRDHYQSYDECNNLINASDAFSQRKLIVSYHINDKLIDNERLKGAHICWYIPNNLTMLDCYDKDYDGKNATISDKPAGASLTECGWNAKPGYKSIYYQMSEDEIEEDKLTFIYRIKSYYEHFNTQNTILCKIITADEYEYEAELPITFSSYGTSGTNYTLSIRPKKDQIVVMDEEDQSLRLGVYLYNYDNSPMEISNLKVSVQGTNSIYTADWNEENKEIVISKKEDPEREEQYFGIVSAITTIIDENQNNKSLDLTAYYPLAYCQENYFIKGPTVVTYDSAGGSNPKYNGSAYQLFSQKDKIEIPIEKCEIIGKDEIKDIERHFLPMINDNNQLKPCAFYVDNIVNDKNNYSFPVIVKITTKENTIFYQSLFIHQNRYGSPMLNAWDGSFVIDEEAGTIMSTMVGAGKKNNDNTFSGMLMGDIASSGLDSGSGIGLYGFHEGAQSFNFNVDGTAFLGKAGHGRILFNGNTGTIQSASYSYLKGNAGMKIDLDDGYLEMRGAIGSMGTGYEASLQSKIYLGVTERDNAYFSIHSKNGNPLIKIGTEEYFLQTDNFSDGTGTYRLEDIAYEDKELYSRTKKAGTRINLQDGKITSYNFTIDAENNAGGKVFLSSDIDEKFPFYIKGNENETFSVGWDGSIFATAGQIGQDVSRGQIIINGILDINTNNKEDGDPIVETQGPYLYLGQLVDKEGETFSNRFHLQSLNFGIGKNDFFLGTSGLLMRDNQNNSDYGMRLTSSMLTIEGSPSDDIENDSDGNETDYSMYSLTTYDGNGITFRKKNKQGSNIFRDQGTNISSVVGRIKMVGTENPKLNISGVKGITFSGGVSLGNNVTIDDDSANKFQLSAYPNIGDLATATYNFINTTWSQFSSEYQTDISNLDQKISAVVTANNTLSAALAACQEGCEGCDNCLGSCQNACNSGQCSISTQSSNNSSSIQE